MKKNIILSHNVLLVRSHKTNMDINHAYVKRSDILVDYVTISSKVLLSCKVFSDLLLSHVIFTCEYWLINNKIYKWNRSQGKLIYFLHICIVPKIWFKRYFTNYILACQCNMNCVIFSKEKKRFFLYLGKDHSDQAALRAAGHQQLKG